MRPSPRCPLCHSDNSRWLETLKQRPEGETDFGIEVYLRHFHRCGSCGLYHAEHDYDFESLYAGQYNASTYANKIEKTFDRIMSLPHDRSDNRFRAQRIHEKLSQEGREPKQTTILDVGSGLCVFLAVMMEVGYRGACVDPDPISAEHAKKIGVSEVFQGSVADVEGSFQALTLNKVLEHVVDPLTMLQDAVSLLEPGGLCYVELPDGEGALKDHAMVDREEFYIEHHYAFDKESTRLLMTKAGLRVDEVHSIVEPSGKFTLYAFGRKEGV